MSKPLTDEQIEERERCANIADYFAKLMEDGCGECEPGERLRQVAEEIRRGWIPGSYECSTCEGAGEWTERPAVDSTNLPGPPMAVICPDCGGSGFHVAGSADSSVGEAEAPKESLDAKAAQPQLPSRAVLHCQFRDLGYTTNNQTSELLDLIYGEPK